MEQYSRRMLGRVQDLFRDTVELDRKRLIQLKKYLIARLARPMEHNDAYRYQDAEAESQAPAQP